MTAPRRVSEEQWNEQELVHIFTEILLQARANATSPTNLPSPAQVLFESIRNAHITPNWPDLVLPNGRSLNSCQHMYMQFVTASSQPALTAPSSFALPASESSSRKRPFQAEALTPAGRTLKPKPATFPPGESGRLSMSAHGSFPLSPLAEPAPSLAALGEPRKKRGRPTKKEQEERRKQMELRAQSLMSPEIAQGTPLSSALPIGGSSMQAAGQLVQVPIATTPQAVLQEESTNSGSSSGKKRRGRPSKAPPTTLEPAPQFSLAMTTSLESPTQTPSSRERRGSLSTRSETTARTQASIAPESSTSAATAREQSEETKRTSRGRIWE